MTWRSPENFSSATALPKTVVQKNDSNEYKQKQLLQIHPVIRDGFSFSAVLVIPDNTWGEFVDMRHPGTILKKTYHYVIDNNVFQGVKLRS